ARVGLFDKPDDLLGAESALLHVRPLGFTDFIASAGTAQWGQVNGVYETLLDGLELQELEQNEGMRAQHILIIDSHRTWWVSGKSYLCRIIDMLNMGLVTEVIFGREVVDRIPQIAQEWIDNARKPV
ncbi:hypothetical protein IPQ54_16690, partial [Xanthomonas perforans]|nr:hypothetical protein [Xanthomonas perforans]